ncbi:MAG: serine protease [Planctomycetota bacterium]
MKVREVLATVSLVFPVVTLLSLAEISRADGDDIRPSVVKIHATQRSPDLVKPWTKAAPKELSGTGFVIEGNRVLTNAHVVRHAATIYLQPYQSAEKVSAKVEYLASPVDLAILTVEDEDFFKDRPPLVMDESLPSVKSKVNVYGYPVGGDELSITEGIISRVEYTRYFYDGWGLRIQIDAALNPGNSGGPAVSNGKLVGISFSGLNDAENIGYLIPIVEVRMFLDDVKDGKYDGKPHLWDVWQTAENDALRDWLKLPKDLGGCMVFSSHRPDDSPLKIGDVITKVGPHSLDRNGNVKEARQRLAGPIPAISCPN